MAYLAKKIGDARVVWFEASNQWAVFDKLQWFIFSLYEKKINRNEAQSELCKHFYLSEKDSRQAVENIYDSLGKLLDPGFPLPDFKHNTGKALRHKLQKKKTREYTYRGKPFRIVYGSPFLEKYIHLPLAHLESGCGQDDIFTAEIFPFESKYILRVKPGYTCLSVDEPGQAKRLLYIELATFFFDKKQNDWMTFIHASAVKKNNEVILLTSAGGSGKSTMAGLLQLHGFDFFSDDFVGVEAGNKMAYPFPAAICAKNETIKLLGEKGLGMYPANAKKTAYIKPAKPLQTNPGEVKKVVFIKYDPDMDLNIRELSILDSLKTFHPEAWIGNDMKRAEIFLNWFEKLKFYKLEYGNNEKAISSLNKLIEQV